MSKYLARNSALKESFKSFCFGFREYPKLGLLSADIAGDSELALRALKIMPKELLAERETRLRRAHLLKYTNQRLPRSQWVKYEDDYNYLQPYMEKIMKNDERKRAWQAIEQ